jgi:phosphoketolase
MGTSLSGEQVRKVDAYWRAANYLSVGQIYLYANPLLKEPLKLEHVKPRLLGHWDTTPGQNFIYVHLNGVIKEHDLSMFFLSGPGHGGPALVANAYLEGTYSEVYPNIGQDEIGQKKRFTQFSFPGGIPSQAASDTPGLVCDGAVLPILHLNGYKIANPTVLARISHEEREALMRGYGHIPYLVEGDNPDTMHPLMAETLDRVIAEIKRIQADAREDGFQKRPLWLLRTDIPELNIRVVNVVDLMTLQPKTEHPHGLSDREFDVLFTRDKPVIFAFHGYPWLIHRLTYRRTNHDNLHVRGYKQEGTTTTPFDMVVLNDLDRYHRVEDVIDRVPQVCSRVAYVQQATRDKPIEHKEYIRKHGVDMPEIRDWKWAKKAMVRGTRVADTASDNV